MPVRRFLNSLNVSRRSRVLKMVLRKIVEAVGRTGPQDSRTRKTQTPHGIACALSEVIHRYSLPSLRDLSVWKPVNAGPGCNPEVAVRPFRQQINDDFLRRIRVHPGKTLSIEAK